VKWDFGLRVHRLSRNSGPLRVDSHPVVATIPTWASTAARWVDHKAKADADAAARRATDAQVLEDERLIAA
jgi:hypothetical protein